MATERRLSPWAVITQSWGVIKRQRRSVFWLFLWLGFLPTAVFGLLRLTVMPLQSDSLLDVMRGSPGESIATAVASLYLTMAATRLVRTDRGGRTAVLADLLRGRRYLLRLLLINIGVSLLVLVGALAFLLPGIYVLLMLSVAAPACVDEDLSVGQALNRSRDLTRGHRLRIGLLLLLCLVGFAGLILIQLLLGALIGLIGEEVLNVASELLLVPVASGLLATGLALVFAVLFFQLRDLSPVVETIAAEGLEPTLSATG